MNSFMEDLLDKRDRGICPICGVRVDVDDFRDDLSKREFGLSGMCQDCQDEFFGRDD